MHQNKVRKAYDERTPCFGIYVKTPSPKTIEFLGAAGMDFVRIDMEHPMMNIQTVHSMIHTALAVGVTPFVRASSAQDKNIDAVLDMGALGIIIPRVTSKQDVQAAVDIVKPAPYGKRKVNPSGFSGGYGKADWEEHMAWAERNIILSVQVETKSGVDAIDEIASVPGLDMVQSGRGDLSYQYGVPGQQHHPLVVEAENKVVEAGLRAQKMVSVQYYPLRDESHVDSVLQFAKRGVYCLSIGGDRDMVVVYRQLLKRLRTGG